MRPSLTWVVQDGDPPTVGAVLDSLPTLDVGRVFLNGRPASRDDALERGDRLEVYPRREPRGGAVELLAQRDGVVLVAKPAGLATETTRQGEDSVVSELLRALGGGRVHAATRLDAPVSGVVACCLGRDASRRFEEWRERGQVRRTYVALALEAGLPDAGEWCWPLGKGRDRAGRDRAVVGGPSAVEARTAFRVLARARGVLLELVPSTGRMHQLRAHAARAGAPLVGDRLYGGSSSVVDGAGRVTGLDRVALHCQRIELPALGATAPVPVELCGIWRALGGRDDDWPSVSG